MVTASWQPYVQNYAPTLTKSCVMPLALAMGR
jgi:hypothetical protein